MSGSALPTWARAVLRLSARGAAAIATVSWRPYSHLMFASDNPSWVIGGEMRELAGVARTLGIPVGRSVLAPQTSGQCVFVGSHFDLLLGDRWFATGHRLATAYFHGKPGTGVPEFDTCFNVLKARHRDVHRIQVSCSGMHAVVLESGIAPDRVFRIPIGIAISLFEPRTAERRQAARAELGLPQSAVVVGSFQKDGVGWGEGMEPKRIKGPDALVAAVARLREDVKDVVVLLSGPARGYVKRELAARGIPFRHVCYDDYRRIGRLYHALDLYLVASREEGGPKAVLESMASGVPLVSTRVGQAVDLVKHEVNGWLADVDDVEAIAHWARQIVEHPEAVHPVTVAARRTAEAHAYAAQIPLWRAFMAGFVE